MIENQEREFFFTLVHEGFITTVGLKNDFIKILVCFGLFNRVF